MLMAHMISLACRTGCRSDDGAPIFSALLVGLRSCYGAVRIPVCRCGRGG